MIRYEACGISSYLWTKGQVHTDGKGMEYKRLQDGHLYGEKTMLHCYRKPNRTKKRTFKACDAARIAREVVRDDPATTPEEVLACIAKGMGFTHISLTRQTVVESAVDLRKVPIKPALLLVEKLLISLLKRFEWLKKALGPILIALKKAIELADKVDRLDPPQEEVDKVINKDKCNCKDAPKIRETR